MNAKPRMKPAKIAAYAVVISLYLFFAWTFYADNRFQKAQEDRMTVEREMTAVWEFLLLGNIEIEVDNPLALINATEAFHVSQKGLISNLSFLKGNSNNLQLGPGVSGKPISRLRPGDLVLRYKSAVYARDVVMPER